MSAKLLVTSAFVVLAGAASASAQSSCGYYSTPSAYCYSRTQEAFRSMYGQPVYRQVSPFRSAIKDCFNCGMDYIRNTGDRVFDRNSSTYRYNSYRSPASSYRPYSFRYYYRSYGSGSVR